MGLNLKREINDKRRELNKILSNDLYNKDYAQKISEQLDELIVQYYRSNN
ncbi:aspartyl-phosphate phosphatase Spo0E family protein [Clostridium sp. D2Q-11]|uniref:Aspartyl-phosphate phosphatase Spo0E family protein n=2 Tax=Anaeromonas frigoriresistens TaxID=2683708 RepID=A0A942Z7U2_9FIRM|nr:aspartyl-phosphate phosphatase Spo0E family protein [Anaeromonas frigoriresistens]